MRPVELTRLDCWARILAMLDGHPTIETFRTRSNETRVVELDILLWLAEGDM